LGFFLDETVMSRKFVIFSILLILAFFITPAKSQKQQYPLAITISPENSTVRLPKKEDDWFDIDFKGTMKNQSSRNIEVVSAEAYKIYPHPYLIKVNGTEARFWSGDFMCAPPFKEQNKVVLKPGGKLDFKFSWHVFVKGFSRKAGKYTFSIRYSYESEDTITMGASKSGLDEVESEWSNEVEVEVVED
jgi:hypothetical protein